MSRISAPEDYHVGHHQLEHHEVQGMGKYVSYKRVSCNCSCHDMRCKFLNGLSFALMSPRLNQSLMSVHRPVVVQTACFAIHRAISVLSLCKICIHNTCILQESSRLGNQLSLRCLVPWTDHIQLVHVCQPSFRKRKLVCTFDIIEKYFQYFYWP